MRRTTKTTAGFTMLEVTIASSLTLGILFTAASLQKAASDSFRLNEVAALPMDEIARVSEQLDKELRLASAGSLEVSGNPFPAPPTAGTPYTSISYRRVLYNPGNGANASTYPDPNLRTLSWNGSNLEIDTGLDTIIIAQDVTNFSVTWDGATSTLLVSLQVRKTPNGGNPFTRTVNRSIYLRNT